MVKIRLAEFFQSMGNWQLVTGNGNGRTGRLLMNYQLMIQGFLPVSIDKEYRLSYYDALDAYSVKGELAKFADLVADLEEKQLNEYLKLENL